MKKFWTYALAVVEAMFKWAFALLAAFICVTHPIALPIAVGFTAVMFSEWFINSYVKVIAATGGGIAGLWLLASAPELILLLVAYQFKKLIDSCIFHVDRKLNMEDLAIPCIVAEASIATR